MYVLARDNQFLIAANLLAILNPISMWVAAVSANLSTKQLRFQSAAQRDQTCLIYLSPSLSHTPFKGIYAYRLHFVMTNFLHIHSCL